MPELPEVETVVRTLAPRLTGQRITSVELNRKDVLSPAECDLKTCLTGRKVHHVQRRGKKIVFLLDDGNQFYIHLGMSGRLTIETPKATRRPHTHFVMSFKVFEVRFVDPRRFGGIWWLGCDGKCDDGIGPEPLTMRPAQLARALSRTKRSIKTALLDQSLVAGLGNIYVDEALFEAKIHPTTTSNELSIAQVSTLNRAIKTTLRRAINHRGSTLRDYADADGKAGGFQKLHRVYGREGKPCARCRTRLSRIVLGGRSTHFCEKCQVIKKRK